MAPVISLSVICLPCKWLYRFFHQEVESISALLMICFDLQNRVELVVFWVQALVSRNLCSFAFSLPLSLRQTWVNSLEEYGKHVEESSHFSQGHLVQQVRSWPVHWLQTREWAKTTWTRPSPGRQSCPILLDLWEIRNVSCIIPVSFGVILYNKS